MLQKMLDALDAPNGVTQDIWSHIVAVIGPDDSAVKMVQSYGGRYYLMPAQKQKLRQMLPFMAGVNLDRIGGGTLALPAHEPEPDTECVKCKQITSRVADGAFMAHLCSNEKCGLNGIKIRYTIERVLRCSRCKGPFHPATGHQFNADTVACGICYGKFAAWQLSNKFGHIFLTSKQKKRIDNKMAKNKKKAERAIKALEKQAAAQAAEREKTYGKPREAQTAQEPQRSWGAERPWYKIEKFPMPIWDR